LPPGVSVQCAASETLILREEAIAILEAVRVGCREAATVAKELARAARELVELVK